MPNTLSPEELRAIDAEFLRAVYEAARRARRQREGQEPPPEPKPEAVALLERWEATSGR